MHNYLNGFGTECQHAKPYVLTQMRVVNVTYMSGAKITTTEWLSFFLMTIGESKIYVITSTNKLGISGWFILLTSLLSFCD